MPVYLFLCLPLSELLLGSQRIPKVFLKANAELLRVRESESISVFTPPLAPNPALIILSPLLSVYPLNYQPS